MELFIILVLGYTASGLTFVLLKRAFHSPAMKDCIISSDPQRAVDSATLHRSVRLNSLVSVVFMFGCSFAFSDFLIYSGDVVLWHIPLQVVMVTLIYDFVYYAVHRYPFHEWKMLRRVHAVHHKTRHPRAVDSLLLHPAETCIGLGAFLVAVALVGGVHQLHHSQRGQPCRAELPALSPSDHGNAGREARQAPPQGSRGKLRVPHHHSRHPLRHSRVSSLLGPS